MCGILGVVEAQVSSATAELVINSANLLRHRGPDDEGFLAFGDCPPLFDNGVLVPAPLRAGYRGKAVILAHRRLSIIDLTAAARQPMQLADDGLVVTFNGEIFNYRELRSELQSYGSKFTTGSDTEVLLASYRRWGEGCLRRFTGMFAFAILDVPQQKLFLARDPFGIKPLFYVASNDSFTFASEIPALLSLSGVRRKANPRRIYEFLNEGTADHGEETCFTDVRQLAPAHYLEIPLGHGDLRVKPVRYWDLDLEQQRRVTFKKAAGELRDLFFESVALHLRSDVPLGIALSGGVDSSAVLMAARKIAGDDADLHSFSYIPDDSAISEEIWIDDVNRAARATPHKIRFSGDDLVRDFESLVRLQGEPFAGPVTYAQLCVFQECQRMGIRVLLEGQGADELLAGYPQYVPHQLRSLMRSGRLFDAIRLTRATGGPSRSQIQRLRAAITPGHQISSFSNPFAWISRSWVARQGFSDTTAAPCERPLKQELYRTLVQTKLPAFLRWSDRSAMACSLENRVPFLTPKLAEFLASLPGDYLLGADGTTKAIFREAMRGIVPESVLMRKDKVGFSTPYMSWIRSMRSTAKELLNELERIPCLDHANVRRDCAPFLSGEHPRISVVHHLWGLLSLLTWARTFNVEFE